MHGTEISPRETPLGAQRLADPEVIVKYQQLVQIFNDLKSKHLIPSELAAKDLAAATIGMCDGIRVGISGNSVKFNALDVIGNVKNLGLPHTPTREGIEPSLERLVVLHVLVSANHRYALAKNSGKITETGGLASAIRETVTLLERLYPSTQTEACAEPNDAVSEEPAEGAEQTQQSEGAADVDLSESSAPTDPSLREGTAPQKKPIAPTPPNEINKHVRRAGSHLAQASAEFISAFDEASFDDPYMRHAAESAMAWIDPNALRSGRFEQCFPTALPRLREALLASGPLTLELQNRLSDPQQFREILGALWGSRKLLDLPAVKSLRDDCSGNAIARHVQVFENFARTLSELERAVVHAQSAGLLHKNFAEILLSHARAFHGVAVKIEGLGQLPDAKTRTLMTTLAEDPTSYAFVLRQLTRAAQGIGLMVGSEEVPTGKPYRTSLIEAVREAALSYEFCLERLTRLEPGVRADATALHAIQHGIEQARLAGQTPETHKIRVRLPTGVTIDAEEKNALSQRVTREVQQVICHYLTFEEFVLQAKAAGLLTRAQSGRITEVLAEQAQSVRALAKAPYFDEALREFAGAQANATSPALRFAQEIEAFRLSLLEAPPAA